MVWGKFSDPKFGPMGLTWGTWGLYLKKHVHSGYTAKWVFLFRPSGAQNHMRNIWELALRFGCISSQGAQRSTRCVPVKDGHGSKVCPKSQFQVSNLANNAVIMLLLSYLIELEQFCEDYEVKLTASIGIGIEVLVFWPVLVLVLVLKIRFFRYWYR